jgi:ABC-type polar amino acid transport system ATPase subunit
MSSSKTVSCTNLVKRYAADKGTGPVSMKLETGKIYALIGPNASGKTTFLRCMCGLETPDSGEIIYTGTDENALLHRLKSSVVFQQPEPWPHLSVLQNIMLPLRKVYQLSDKEARLRAEQELDRLGLTGRGRALGHQLSGGLRQRCVMARTLAMRPYFLYLDEPTSALDPEWTDSFRKIIMDYASQGNMVMVVSHQMNFLKSIAHYVYYMKDGQVREEGPPASLFSNPHDESLIRFLQNA